MDYQADKSRDPVHNGVTWRTMPLRTLRFIAVLTVLQIVGFAQQTQTYAGHYLVPFPGPQAYKDPTSGTLLYVETDGRHVAAISGEGKLLWNHDPFSDAHLEIYRTEKPQIVYLGPSSKSSHSIRNKNDYVAISFNNSQFGWLRITDGYFEVHGQD